MVLSYHYHTTIIPLSKLWNLHIFDSGLIVIFSAVCEWILPGDFAILWVSNAECGWDAGRSKRGDATDGRLAARTGEEPEKDHGQVRGTKAHTTAADMHIDGFRWGEK